MQRADYVGIDPGEIPEWARIQLQMPLLAVIDDSRCKAELAEQVADLPGPLLPRLSLGRRYLIVCPAPARPLGPGPAGARIGGKRGDEHVRQLAVSFVNVCCSRSYIQHPGPAGTAVPRGSATDQPRPFKHVKVKSRGRHVQPDRGREHGDVERLASRLQHIEQLTA